MRIFAAGVVTETNSFSPFPTTLSDFEAGGIWRGTASAGSGFLGGIVARWARRAEADGHTFVEGLIAEAAPGGATRRDCWEDLRDELLEPLLAGSFDVVLLLPHGAMMADGYDDCEGDLLKRVRESCGASTVVGALLDPHCHLSGEMVQAADLLVFSREYPHVDYPARADQLYDLCMATKRQQVRPVAAVFDCRMIGYFPTGTEPMAGFVRRLAAAETESGVLACGFVHGFELGDSPDLGAKVIVYADTVVALAESVAKRLGLDVYRLRHALLPTFLDAGAALDAAGRTAGLSVIADVGDNPGAGFAGDNMGLVREALRRCLDHVVAGFVWDPMIVERCANAGVGATFDVRLGGKSGPASGPPMDVRITVRALVDDLRQRVFDQGERSCGRTARIGVVGPDAFDIVVVSHREQVFAREPFEQLGVNWGDRRLALVKSAQHFRPSFEPVAAAIFESAAPDTIGLDLKAIPHRRKAFDYFPRVADPLQID